MKFENRLWTPEDDCTEFVSSLKSIQKFMHEEADWAMANNVSTVFVLTKKGEWKVCGYYTWS
ncbi:MAG: hypothetical protein K2X81_03805 [Candidatus Obscuribacterales bacterium]|nr:hypothetical protein [Candidatus Obscuribacterales bacterium]